jgi:predicted Zn finger-like uncharacterized protein
MPLKATCPHCKTAYTLDDRVAGKKARCRRCKKSFVVSLGPEAGKGPSAPGPVPGKNRFRLVLGMSIAAGLLVIAGVILVVILLIPSNVDQKLADLKTGDVQTRQQALLWLAQADPDDAHRGGVTAALEPLLFEGDITGALNPDVLLRTYLHWAGPDNVPALMRLVENPTLPSWNPSKTGLVMDALGRLKDERAMDVLAEKLPDPVLGKRAASALQLLGPRGEKAVLDYLFDKDPATRQRAGQLLADYGTRPKTIAAEALDRLTVNQAEVQCSAAAWFAENPPDAGMPRDEAAKRLADLLGDLSPKVNAEALRALKLWATKDSLPSLVDYARRQEKAGSDNPVLIDVLAQFRDETAAEAIAGQLKKKPQRARAVQALIKLGPVATKAVLGYLNYPDPAVQKEVRSLCRLLNISTDRQLEQTLADVADPKVSRSRTALEYLARLRPDAANRTKVSKALNAPLLDANKEIREAALDAVQVWGTKENTATLVKALGTAMSGGPGRNARIVEILGTLQDPTAAPALALGLTCPPERLAVGKALKAIGPGAEDAVIPYVQSRDGLARIEACSILADIGTAKSLDPLKTAMNAYDLDLVFVQQAQLAAQKILARQ